MITVPQYELEQKIAEFVIHVREYYINNQKKDFKVVSKRDNALLVCFDGEVTLDFSL